MDELGGRTKAESELKAREKRVEDLTITTLAPAEAARFSQAWNALQARFVDNPKGIVLQADNFRELILDRGYPMGDFERRAVARVGLSRSVPLRTWRMQQIWDEASASHGRALEQLRALCTQSEGSSILALRKFALRLRTYAPPRST